MRSRKRCDLIFSILLLFSVVLIFGFFLLSHLNMIQIIPVTRINPDSKAFKATTRFPRNRPANNIKTVPGVMVDRTRGGFLTGTGPFLTTISSAG
jgi:hypothetical protein